MDEGRRDPWAEAGINCVSQNRRTPHGGGVLQPAPHYFLMKIRKASGIRNPAIL